MGLVSILRNRSQRLTTSCGALVDWETKTVPPKKMRTVVVPVQREVQYGRM